MPAVNGCLLDNNPTVSSMYSETTTPATEYYTGIKYIDVLDYMELSEYSSRLSRCVTDLCNYADHCDPSQEAKDYSGYCKIRATDSCTDAR